MSKYNESLYTPTPLWEYTICIPHRKKGLDYIAFYTRAVTKAEVERIALDKCIMYPGGFVGYVRQCKEVD